MIVPAQILQSLEESNQPSFLLEGSVEMNVDQNGFLLPSGPED